MNDLTPSSEIFSASQLGAEQRTFRPGLTNIIAGYILAIGAATAGVFIIGWLRSQVYWRMPLWADREMSWGAAAVICLAIVFAFSVTILLTMWMWSLQSFRVVAHEQGLLVHRKSSQQAIPWEAVTEVVEHIVYERLPVVKGAAKLLIPKTASRYYVVKRRDGESFSFDGNAINKLAAFAKGIRAAATTHDIPWSIVEEQG